MRGRLPKPTALKVLAGNPGRGGRDTGPTTAISGVEVPHHAVNHPRDAFRRETDSAGGTAVSSRYRWSYEKGRGARCLQERGIAQQHVDEAGEETGGATAQRAGSGMAGGGATRRDR